jgi:hypothetical protein
MHDFLKDVTKDIFNNNVNISDCIIILPNKRSGFFLKEEINFQVNNTIFSPRIYEIDDFMSLVSGVEKISNTDIIFELYKTYCESKSKKKPENFEEFISWGKSLLVDFNEIDKEICDTKSLFGYLEAYKELNHWSSFENETNLIKNYKFFWKNINILYSRLYERLLKKKLGYQGLIYREAFNNIESYVRENKDIFHVFVGFNALSKSEAEVIQKLISNNGEIYWDIDKTLYNSEYNNSSFFIKEYHQNWSYFKNNNIKILNENYSSEKNILSVGTPKNIGQIKYVGEILKKIENKELNNTAIVLVNEQLLIPMINSIPRNIDNINVTMGYPLKNSPIYSFFNLLLKIHFDSNKSFYYKNIIAIISHELISPIIIDGSNFCKKIINENLIYLNLDEIKDIDNNKNLLFELIFSKWETVKDGIENIIEIIEIIKIFYSKKIHNKINIEFLFEINKIFTQIKYTSIKFKYVNSFRALSLLFRELCEMTSTPFESQSRNGLQIMGMLETRLINYKNIIIVSANEGSLPSGKSNYSFIPFEIRRVHKLQTYRERDAIFAYHFFRLISRAKNIWLTYNTEPNGFDSGEISRFIKQIQIEGIHKVREETLVPTTPIIKRDKVFYKKTNKVIEELEKLMKNGVSASMLTNYIRDKVNFFNSYILKIKDDSVEETLGNSTLGNIVHDSIEEIYKSHTNKYLTKSFLEQLKCKVYRIVKKNARKYVNEKYLKKGKNLIIIKTAEKYVMNAIEIDLKEINNGNKIKLIDVEVEFKKVFEFNNQKIKIRGKIDRIDQINNTIRIIDYKTGKKIYAKDLRLKNKEQLFEEKGIYNLQLVVYAIAIYDEFKKRDLKTGIISLKNRKDGFLTAFYEENKYLSSTEIDNYKEIVCSIINEIKDPEVKFEN